MATMPQVLIKMLESADDSSMSFQFVNSSLLSVKAAQKKKPASIEIAVDGETAQNFLTFGEYKQVGILIMVDKATFLETNEKIDGEKGEMKK